MYAAQLKRKPEFQHLNKSTHLVNHFNKMQMHQLENLKNELEFKKAKAQSIALRNKTLQFRDKINYTNELNKIRGYLSSYDHRFPIGTIDRLENRIKELKKLGAEITN